MQNTDSTAVDDLIVDAAYAKPFATRDDYLTAIAKVRSAAAAYENSDNLEMDDATYDAFVARIAATEVGQPEWKVANSPTETVAAGVSTGGDVTHSVPMLSLDNVFNEQELREWAAGLDRVLGRKADGYTVEPKLDGLALSARYVDGVLVLASTRGDGGAGEDVTANARLAAGLPEKLTRPVTVEVRGEVFMTDADFVRANEMRDENGDARFKNPRNGAAGSIRAQNRGYDVPLSFLAYAVHGTDGEPMAHSEAMAYIAELGVSTTAQSAAGMPVCTTVDEVVAAVNALGAKRDSLGFPIDGAVVKADRAKDRDDAGSSSKSPRWGRAYKFPADTRTTKLKAITVQVGRTGVLTPVAELETVLVGGVDVSRATLHNFDDLAKRNVRVGDTVFVWRAGEVIPEITGAKLDERPADSVPYEPPTHCPNCGGDIDRSQKRWRCTKGRACLAGQVLKYAVARDCMDIDGIGAKLIDALVAAGKIADFADLYDLDVATLAAMERMGETSAEKLVANIQASKSQPLSRVLTALGIRMTGRSLSRRIARHFGTMPALQAATVQQIQQIDGIGNERGPWIAAELADLAPVIAKLVERGVNMVEPTSPAVATADSAPSGSLPFEKDGKPMTVVVTGSVPGMTRNEGNESVERLGGKSSGSVSKSTHLVVVGPGAGSKAAKADELKIPTLDSGEYARLVAAAAAGDSDTVAEILVPLGLI